MTTRAYLRISLATAESGSIQKQRERIAAAEVAAGRDPESIAFYADEGVSGSRAVDRPGRDRLLADLASGDRLVALKIDRLARNVRDLLDIADHTESVGATLHVVDDGISTEGAFGRFLLTILGALAEFEAKTTGERVRASRESFKAAGRHSFGKLPVGFRSVPNPDGPGLVVALDPETAPAVREAVLRVMAGESQNTVRKSIGLSKTGMHKLLTNPRLAGMTPDGGSVVKVNGTPRVNSEAAILSMQEWQALSEFMANGEKAWSRQTGFGRVIICGVCAERMYVNVSKRNDAYSTYRCRKTNHEPGQPGLSVMRDAANEYVEDQFLSMFGDMPYRTIMKVQDDSARTEAIALASVRVTEAEKAMRSADRSTRRTLQAELMAAYDALEDAEGIPVEVRETARDSGSTVTEIWAEATPDMRESMVAALGAFFVVPFFKGPIESRVMWVGFISPEDARDRFGFPVVFRSDESGTVRLATGQDGDIRNMALSVTKSRNGNDAHRTG